MFIEVGGTGFEPESNWKYKDDGTSCNPFLIVCRLPPLNVFVSSTFTGI